MKSEQSCSYTRLLSSIFNANQTILTDRLTLQNELIFNGFITPQR